MFVAKKRTVHVLAVGFVLGVVACGGDDGNGDGSGDSIAQLCASICEKTAALSCPDEGDCAASCEAEAMLFEGCEEPSRVLLACGDARPLSDYECDTDGESATKGGICSAEFDLLLACLLGGGSGSDERDAGSGGSGGGTAPITGPAISSAPDDWMRPADCGGIGDACMALFGCGERSTCQSVGDVCIPALESGASSLPAKSAERPYCAAFTCMTYEEASCFCTGDGGSARGDCASPSALAGLCLGRGSRCETDPCCDGLSCVDDGFGRQVCDQTCTTADDCETGCCTDVRDLGYLVCAEQDACDNPCKKRGETCTPGSATMPNDCCRGGCLQSDNPDFDGCRPDCNTHEDCPDTGCCMPFTGETRGFCADALYCSCGSVDDPCGQQGLPVCCDDTVCAGTSDDALTCRQLCTSGTECTTGCCAPLASGDKSICSGPEYCQ